MSHVITDPARTGKLAQDVWEALTELVQAAHYRDCFDAEVTMAERAVFHEKVNALANAYTDLEVYCEDVSREVRARHTQAMERTLP